MIILSIHRPLPRGNRADSRVPPAPSPPVKYAHPSLVLGGMAGINLQAWLALTLPITSFAVHRAHGLVRIAVHTLDTPAGMWEGI